MTGSIAAAAFLALMLAATAQGMFEAMQ